jgi:hypothetical protein
VSRREQIKISNAEVAAFLTEQRILTCATLGPRGWPHLMPLWYVLRDPPEGEPAPRLWAWTYAASQKVRNLERDGRATLQVEAGESYEVLVHRDVETVAGLGQEIFQRYASSRGQAQVEELDPEVAAMVERQAAKRVGLEFIERHRATWDHRKLGGAY